MQDFRRESCISPFLARQVIQAGNNAQTILRVSVVYAAVSRVSANPLRQNLVDDVAKNVGQPKIAPCVADRQTFVVQPQ